MFLRNNLAILFFWLKMDFSKNSFSEDFVFYRKIVVRDPRYKIKKNLIGVRTYGLKSFQRNHVSCKMFTHKKNSYKTSSNWKYTAVYNKLYFIHWNGFTTGFTTSATRKDTSVVEILESGNFLQFLKCQTLPCGRGSVKSSENWGPALHLGKERDSISDSIELYTNMWVASEDPQDGNKKDPFSVIAMCRALEHVLRVPQNLATNRSHRVNWGRILTLNVPDATLSIVNQ